MASSEDRELTSQSRQESEPVVMMPPGENSTLEETAYLMRSPANAERLIRSIGEMRAGKAKVRHLIEE
ncbi:MULTISPECIES: prevent-host-death protein [Pseudomonas]|uniref:prevent-host-death protein n=1 Tax=Pseudomonas TaxID=286 RepID=UPI0009DB2838|nr:MULTISPECIES: prevent-host-death protein [Pseudomonas]